MTAKRLSISMAALAAVAVLRAATAATDTVVVTRIDTVVVERVDTVRLPMAVEAELPIWQRRVQRYTRTWNNLIPKGLRMQWAGNMGRFSAGPVWIYGRNRQWETALMVGYIPRRHGDATLTTMTLKQDFTPWRVPLGGHGRVSFEPLSTGMYFNTVFSDKFWTRQPERYPSGYYWFSTRLRPSIYVGERLTYHIPSKRRVFAHSVSAFYELSTCDFYLIQCVKNRYITPGKILTLSLGLQVEWL